MFPLAVMCPSAECPTEPLTNTEPYTPNALFAGLFTGEFIVTPAFCIFTIWYW